jgi:acyl-coenzyme A thioesterase PaaI-like protein
MKYLTPFLFKFFMNVYPPLFFGRTRITKVSKDFGTVEVVAKRSFLNKNWAGTIFGGTIFSAADPFHAMMYRIILNKRHNIDVRVWLKHADITYKRPADTNLYYSFVVTDEDAIKAKEAVLENGRYFITHKVEACNKKGEVCAIINLTTYIGKRLPYKPSSSKQ